ncbi:MAG: tyrosine-type recombinase/integrase [Actinobacteria bacterium]|nr:tyrosine-type recombinase/integrase [Actinomycetota bacterium]
MSAKLERTSTPGIYRKGARYVVVFRDAQGRQRKRSARTIAEARTLKAALTTDVRRNEYVEETRLAFADYAARWIETYEGRTARGIRAGTLRDYRRALGLDEHGEQTGGGAVAYFGRTPLASIRPQDVKAYAAHVAARGVARNTVRLAVAPVKALLATAHEEGLIRANPAAGLRLGRAVAKSPVKETHALTEDEVVRVLGEVPERDRLLCEALAQTGLRISEALALTKADIDFGRRRLSVSRRLYDGELDAPKSKHGVRRVPLSPELARRLWLVLATKPGEAVVFPGVDRTGLYRVVRAAGERAGIEWPVGLHTFRHSAASIMFRRGVPKEAIRRLLGHHSWDFTAGTYVHLDDDDLPDGAIVGDLTANTRPEIVDADGVTGEAEAV